MGYLTKEDVSPKSTDKEIIDALKEAGTHRLSHRKDAWPKEGETDAWVLPTDIAEPHVMINRLNSMALQGLIEKEGGTRPRFRPLQN